MGKSRFTDQPTLVKIAVGLTLYNVFVFFEELVIDRYGIWQHLPFYKFGKLCVWDIGAMIAIGGFVASGFARRFGKKEAMRPGHSTIVKMAIGLMFINSFVLFVGILDRYKILNKMPAAVLLVLLLAIIGGITWWAVKHPAPASSLSIQPLLLKVSAGLALYNAFLFIEYFVINPSGLGQFIPLYKVEGASLWDYVIPIVIGALVWSKGFRMNQALQTQ